MRAMPSTMTTDAVLAARQRFFDRGDLPDGLIAGPILRSWQRCAKQGMTGLGLPRVEPLDSQALRHLQDRHGILRRTSRPELETLRAAALRSDGVVILTDGSGFILDVAGNPSFADRASQVLLRPGIHWSETVTGTNAIGTALIERRPIGVHGAEHFFEPHRMLACAAAPIIDPAGRLAGVLDMSGHAAIRHSHALDLVRFAVGQIEHRFFDHGFEHCAILRFHSDPALLGSAREGILAFDGDRLAAANRHALRLLELDWTALHRVTLADLFGRVTPSDAEQTVRTLSGACLTALFAAPRRPPAGRGAEAAKPTAANGAAAAARAIPAAEPGPLFSAPVRACLDRTVRLLEADIPVLICGETGTGKEVFARQAHAASSRRNKPFIAVNCAALPENLIESELFGYEEGAFTGARRRGHKGLLRQAEGGILFLDEIGDMPLPLQSRLLRVLQDRAVSPLGGESVVPVNFALLCATHRPLAELVAAGTFREDLFFRIAPFVAELPPVREHPDCLALIRTLWASFGGGAVLPAEAEQRLAAYGWPGNFRQMVSTLRTIAALSEPGLPVDLSALPAGIQHAATRPNPAAAATDDIRPLGALTRDAIDATLKASNGNVARAARRLGIDRSTLYRHLSRQSGSPS
jgi:transcriptional regulator of acetoin/glycerol metabolism